MVTRKSLEEFGAELQTSQALLPPQIGMVHSYSWRGLLVDVVIDYGYDPDSAAAITLRPDTSAVQSRLVRSVPVFELTRDAKRQTAKTIAALSRELSAGDAGEDGVTVQAFGGSAGDNSTGVFAAKGHPDDVDPSDLMNRVLMLHSMRAQSDEDTAIDEVREQVGRRFGSWAEDLKSNPRPGKAGRADIWYAKLASDYVEQCSVTRKPIAVMAAAQSYSPQRIRNSVDEARRRGLLTPPPRPGIAGGELTPKAAALLESTKGGQDE